MAKYVIRAPVEGFTGMSWGLDFRAGVAETDDAALAGKLRELGYGTEREPSPEPSGQPAKAPKPRKGNKTGTVG